MSSTIFFVWPKIHPSRMEILQKKHGRVGYATGFVSTTHLKFNSSPLKIYRVSKGRLSSNHHFSGVNSLLNFGGVALIIWEEMMFLLVLSTQQANPSVGFRSKVWLSNLNSSNYFDVTVNLLCFSWES